MCACDSLCETLLKFRYLDCGRGGLVEIGGGSMTFTQGKNMGAQIYANKLGRLKGVCG